MKQTLNTSEVKFLTIKTVAIIVATKFAAAIVMAIAAFLCVKAQEGNGAFLAIGLTIASIFAPIGEETAKRVRNKYLLKRDGYYID